MRFLLVLLGSLTASASDFLDEVFQVGPPMFRLDTIKNSVLEEESSLFICTTVTVPENPVNIFWFVDGKDIDDESLYDVQVSKISIIKLSTQDVSLRYGTLRIHNTVKSTMVTCLVEYVKEPQNRLRLTTNTVVLRDHTLHAYHGSLCGGSTECVGRGTRCDRVGPVPFCTCKHNWRFDPMTATCVSLRKHREPCFSGIECALPTDTCIDNWCLCKPQYSEVFGVCYSNSTLGGGCDWNNICPPHSNCINSVCVCRKDYYARREECAEHTLSSAEMHRWTTIGVTAFIISFVFLLGWLAQYLYFRSYTPAVMHDLSTAAWECVSKSDKL
ncbi:uncharacterized protein LOC135383776 [Ornithodoros turicata]|uniref:uncharacterized protein LOC135383776 n=1 Tax=Ornithodoros turicata TaxID=34597 RepID=UPI00313A2913